MFSNVTDTCGISNWWCSQPNDVQLLISVQRYAAIISLDGVGTIIAVCLLIDCHAGTLLALYVNIVLKLADIPFFDSFFSSYFIKIWYFGIRINLTLYYEINIRNYELKFGWMANGISS